MKRKLQLLGALILSFFITAPLMYAQGNMQSDTTSDAEGNMQNDRTSTGMTSDTGNTNNAEEYYQYAKKNIIEDKSPDEEYQGKWVDSSMQATSDSEKDWSNENDSNESMNNMNGQNDQMNQQRDKTNQQNDQMNDQQDQMNQQKDQMDKQKNKMNKQKDDAKDKMNQMKKDTTKSGGNDNY